MIRLPVDESYAFDFLSILEIKAKYNSSDRLRDHTAMCAAEIRSQIGDAMFDDIAGSDEYMKLKDANADTFRLVDLAKTDAVRASDVDYSNIVRFNARKALQDRFFPGGVAEVKVGYEKAYGDRK